MEKNKEEDKVKQVLDECILSITMEHKRTLVQEIMQDVKQGKEIET